MFTPILRTDIVDVAPGSNLWPGCHKYARGSAFIVFSMRAI